MCGNKTTFMVICVYKGGNINFPSTSQHSPCLYGCAIISLFRSHSKVGSYYSIQPSTGNVVCILFATETAAAFA